MIASFFYSAREGESETNHQHMLQTLLCEALSLEPALYPLFQDTYRRLRAISADLISWSYTDLKTIFINMAGFDEKPLSIFFLMDALDESDRRQLADVLLVLKDTAGAWMSLNKKTAAPRTCVVKVILASRPDATISSALTEAYHVVLEEENQNDIATLVDTELSFLREPTDSSLFEWTSAYLKNQAQGVFLWVSLVARELKDLAEGGYSEAEIKTVVLELPVELIDYYKRIIKQLAELGPTVVAEAKKMLEWACCTERPLTAIELREIIAMQLTPTRISKISVHAFEASKLRRLDDMRKRVRRNCGDLLEIRKQNSVVQSPANRRQQVDPSDVIQLLHQTAREFLIKRDKIARPFNVDETSANNEIGSLCTHYLELSLTTDQSAFPLDIHQWTSSDYRRLLQHFDGRPLLHYVLLHLPQHLSHIEHFGSQAWRLIDDYFQLTKSSSGFAWYLLQDWFEMRIYPTLPTLPAYKEPNTACEEQFIKEEPGTDGKSRKSVPRNQSREVAAIVTPGTESMLVFRIACLINGIEDRKFDVVRSLCELQRHLDYVDGDTKNTPLQTAAASGNTEIVDFLIRKGAAVNFHGGYFGTALQAAAYHGHREVVLVLLDNGADPNSFAGFWTTAFLAASCAGHEETAKTLLEHGADPEFTSDLDDNLISAGQDRLETYGRRVLSVLDSISPDSFARLRIMGFLGQHFKNQGCLEEAMDMFLQAHEFLKRNLGTEHPETLQIMCQIATIYREQGRWKEAEETYLEVRELYARILGPEHPTTRGVVAILELTWRQIAEDKA